MSIPVLLELLRYSADGDELLFRKSIDRQADDLLHLPFREPGILQRFQKTGTKPCPHCSLNLIKPPSVQDPVLLAGFYMVHNLFFAVCFQSSVTSLYSQVFFP